MSGGSPGVTLLHSTCSLMCQWNVEIMNVEYIPLLDYNNIIIIIHYCTLYNYVEDPYSLVPRRATLKTWEWPGDKARGPLCHCIV